MFPANILSTYFNGISSSGVLYLKRKIDTLVTKGQEMFSRVMKNLKYSGREECVHSRFFPHPIKVCLRAIILYSIACSVSRFVFHLFATNFFVESSSTTSCLSGVYIINWLLYLQFIRRSRLMII